MTIDRAVMADTTNLWPKEWFPQGLPRERLVALARKYGYDTALVVFDLSLDRCMDQNRSRNDRDQIPEEQIRGQRVLLDQTLSGLDKEGWDRIVRLNDDSHSWPPFQIRERGI